MGDHEELGGWGQEYTLFGAHNRIDAINAGYIEGDKNHKLLLWNAEVYSAPEGGNKTVERPGLVVRFLHYFGDEVNEEDKQAAQNERNVLTLCNGTKSKREEL